MTDVSTTCAVVIFRDKVSCIASIDGILKTLVINLISQSCRDVIGRLSVKPSWFWMPLARFVYSHQLT